MPDIVLPKQFYDLIHVRARYKGFYGGRGSGKSHALATAAIIRCVNTTRPLRILCCREIQRSIKESVKFLLDKKIVAFGMADRFTSTSTEIADRKSGTRIIFEGLRANITAIQSLDSIDVAWIEEAQSISQTSLNVLYPTLRAEGSELWFSWNPKSKKDPVDAMFRSGQTEDSPDDFLPGEYDRWMISQRVNYDANPFFPAISRAEMERDRRRDPDKYAHIWLGEYLNRSDMRVFHNWTVGTMEVPPEAIPRYGADWGFSIDPTVLLRCYVFMDRRVMYIDREVSQVGCAIDRTPELFDELDEGQARKWPIRADSSRPETINYMVSHGYPLVVAARKGPGSVEEGVEFLKNFDIIIHPNCKRTIDEFATYSYEVDKLTDEVLPKLADKDNHVIDAARYAVEELRRGGIIASPIIVTGPRPDFGAHPESFQRAGYSWP